MSKLHELLAVEGDLSGTAKKLLEETYHVFTNKPDHFKGHVKNLTMFDEVRNENEGGEQDRKAIVTTVADKITYLFKHLVKYYDAVAQKESTNQKARADVILDGKVLIPDMPATFLLGLEDKLKKVRNVLESIPTLQPGIEWDVDGKSGSGVYKTKHPITTYKTEKIIKSVVLSEATKEHPAQVQAYNEDIKVGKYKTESLCSMYSPKEKSDVLAKVDKLIRGVKKARQRANNIDVENVKVGETLLGYILGE